MRPRRLRFFPNRLAAIAGLQPLVDFAAWDAWTAEPPQRDHQVMKKLSEYVKVAEAAFILGVAQNTVRAWAENGTLPVHRNPANGYRLFRRSDLDTFLKKVSNSSTPPRPRKVRES